MKTALLALIMLVTFLALPNVEGIIKSAEATPGSDYPVMMRPLVRVLVGASDRMTTYSSAEAQMFPIEGQLFYILKDKLSGTVPIYRLNNGSDHMESLYSNEGGYTSEGVIGYAWTSPFSQSGTSPLYRAVKVTTNDHMTHHLYESLPSGYVDEGSMGYGFRRYNNSDQTLVLFSGGGITAHANLAAGAAVWDWTWNGVQFLNDHDCGRQLQTAVQSEYRFLDAPECGDKYFYNGIPAVPAWKKHGSPVVSYSVNGAVFQSSAIPLDYGWLWNNHWGTSQDIANLWTNWRVGKTITLNFNNMGPVAKYQASITAPISVTDSRVEFPGVHLRANFNRFWALNVGSNVLTEVTSAMPNGCSPNNPGYEFRATYGGVIVSDATTNYAMGIYTRGGPTTYLAMFKFWCRGDGTEQYADDTSKLMANYYGTLGSSYTSYVINGTVEGVRNKMLQLKAGGF